MEKWRSAPGFPDYAVSTDGVVRRIVTQPGSSRGKVLRPYRSGSNGGRVPTRYVSLSRDGKKTTKSIAVLTLETFVGPKPKGFVLRHVNGDRMDNRLDNLRWEPGKSVLSRAENRIVAQQRVDLAGHRAALIRSLHDLRVPAASIAAAMGLSEGTVRHFLSVSYVADSLPSHDEALALLRIWVSGTPRDWRRCVGENRAGLMGIEQKKEDKAMDFDDFKVMRRTRAWALYCQRCGQYWFPVPNDKVGIIMDAHLFEEHPERSQAEDA